MPKFIKVTRSTGEFVYLNSDSIVKIVPAEGADRVKSIIYYNIDNGRGITVLESVDSILTQIEGKAYVK